MDCDGGAGRAGNENRAAGAEGAGGAGVHQHAEGGDLVGRLAHHRHQLESHQVAVAQPEAVLGKLEDLRPEVRFLVILQLRQIEVRPGALLQGPADTGRQGLAQFHPPLVESIDAPDDTFHEYLVLVEGQQLPKVRRAQVI